MEHIPTFPLPVGHGFQITAVLLYPKSRGSISLKSPDPSEAPLIDPNLMAVPGDADAACAPFVFLDLLNRHAQSPRKHRLRYALDETKRADSSTEGRIDRPSPLDASGVHGSAPREDARMEARFSKAQ